VSESPAVTIGQLYTRLGGAEWDAGQASVLQSPDGIVEMQLGDVGETGDVTLAPVGIAPVPPSTREGALGALRHERPASLFVLNYTPATSLVAGLRALADEIERDLSAPPYPHNL